MIGGVILCIGDSMTNGARSPRAYPHILGDILSKEFKQCWIGINKGVNGETSCDLLDRVFDHMKSYPMAHEVIVTIGSNDAKDTQATPLEIYAANWRYIVNCAEFFGKKLYIGLVPEMKGFGAPDYSQKCNERIKEYNQFLLSEYRGKYPIIDFEKFQDSEFIDGVHFNHEGYKTMADRASKVIKQNRNMTGV